MRNEAIILTKNNIEICAQSFGSLSNETLLLIMGEASSMLWWEDKFCKDLAESGFFVIRYDQRDTGKSTTYPEKTINYKIEDLAEDAISVLDYYQIERAHILGKGLGAEVAQLLALRYKDRVLSLLLAMTRAINHNKIVNEKAKEILDYNEIAKDSVNLTKQQVIDQIANNWKLLENRDNFEEETIVKAIATKEVERAINIQSRFNHFLLEKQIFLEESLESIKIPVLIIYGDSDPLYDYQNAEILKEEFKQAKIITLKGVGHILTLNIAEYVLQDITSFLKSTIPSKWQNKQV